MPEPKSIELRQPTTENSENVNATTPIAYSATVPRSIRSLSPFPLKSSAAAVMRRPVSAMTDLSLGLRRLGRPAWRHPAESCIERRGGRRRSVGLAQSALKLVLEIHASDDAGI